VEKCRLAEQKRSLAVRSLGLARERCRLDELRLSLGQITRLDLMETLIEYTKKEIMAVEAATSLLESERELERFLDISPGGLARFAALSGL
jgi:outer membrane protein TolC